MGIAFTGACGEAPPPAPVEAVGVPAADPPVPVATIRMDAPAFGPDAPVRPVFPTADGGWVVPTGDGRIVTLAGVVPVPKGVPCGAGLKITHPTEVFAFLPPGAPESFGEVPSTMAAQVERFAWRLGDVLGPRPGLRAGGSSDVDPATWEGIHVRSVKKTRRSGPPVLVGVGDRDGTVVVVVSDRDAERVLGSATFVDPLPGQQPVPGTVPAFDADGDGNLDVFVYGKAEQGVFRARVAIDPGEPVRVAGSAALASAPIVCP